MIFLMSVPRERERERERGFDGVPMEGMFVEIDRGWWGSGTWKKTINVHIFNTQICLRICTG